MAETLADLRATVQEAVNDATSASVDLELNRRYREFVVRGRWRLAEKSIATTVAGQGQYLFDAGDQIAVQDVEKIRVSADSYIDYSYVDQTDLWRLKDPTSGVWLAGGGGVFGPYNTTAGRGFELYPAPDKSALSVVALVALEPVTLTTGTDVFDVPPDLVDRIADGAIGRLLKRSDEKIPEGNDWLASFNEGIDLLRQRAVGLIGEGPIQITPG